MELTKSQREKISLLLREGTEPWHALEKELIYKALASTCGEEADNLVIASIGERTETTWREIAEICDDNSLAVFLSLLFGPLPDAGWEFTKKEADGKITYCVTKCPKYELAKELGVENLFYLLNCATDFYSAKGFNPKIRFERTKTLMTGDDCCNHTYSESL